MEGGHKATPKRQMNSLPQHCNQVLMNPGWKHVSVDSPVSAMTRLHLLLSVQHFEPTA